MNKSEIKKKCSSILNSGRSIIDLGSEDFDFLVGIFMNHPDIDYKLNEQQIIQIKIRPTQYHQRCFSIKRSDGSETDISFHKCIDGESSLLKQITRACLYSIESEIIRLKNCIIFPYVCPVTGELLYGCDEIEIDHYDMTFKELVAAWVAHLGGADKVKPYLSTYHDNEIHIYFTDDRIKQNFISFHDSHTHLRAVSRKANRSDLKKLHNNM